MSIAEIDTEAEMALEWQTTSCCKAKQAIHQVLFLSVTGDLQMCSVQLVELQETAAGHLQFVLVTDFLRP